MANQYYYTKTQTDQQAGIIGERLRAVRTDLTSYVDSTKISQEERDKLAYLESSKFLGTFLTSEAIPTEGAIAGNYADVDAGVGETVSRWIYDVDSGAFVQATGEVAGETSASVKEKYESNPNTNAFTDNHKTTLEALQGLAPAATIESFLDAFNAAILGITPGTVIVDLSSLQSDLPQSTPGSWKSRFYSNDVDSNASPGDPLHSKTIYSNRIVEEINLKYPALNLLPEEVSISYDVVNSVYNVTPNDPRVTGTLNVQFYNPL